MVVSISKNYSKRPVRFLELYQYDNWNIKIYSISVLSEIVSDKNINNAKEQLGIWLKNVALYPLPTYKIATLILHEGKEGCFAIINWWIDESMLQQFVYLAKNASPEVYDVYSDKGIITCVWEMAVLWFERNAWVTHILCQHENPDWNAYLEEQLNIDI